MNNDNRYILKQQLYKLEGIKFENQLEELDDLLEKIESLKEDEEANYDKLKGGLKEVEIGLNMEGNIDIFTQAIDITAEIREYIDKINCAIENVKEAL